MDPRNEMNDVEATIDAKVVNGEDPADIISDQDQTFLYDRRADLRGRGGPASFDLEDEPEEFARGEIDVKTQMDRTTRIAKANANRHYDLDETPDSTPGGLEEVIARTEKDLNLRPRSPADSLEAKASDREADEPDLRSPDGVTFLTVEDIENEVDLEAEKLDLGEMNEEDARESGYIESDRTRPLPQGPSR